MKRAYLALTWGLGTSCILGPYETAATARETALDLVRENAEGGPHERGGVIGPFPIEYLNDTPEAPAAFRQYLADNFRPSELEVLWRECKAEEDDGDEAKLAAIEEAYRLVTGSDLPDAGPADAPEIPAVKRTWAVFETAEENLEWMMSLDAAGAESAASNFDNQAGNPGEFIWVGNYTGATPAEAYAEANENRPLEKTGKQYVAVPIGVFGPTDWMRAAGEVLSRIDG